MAHSAHFNRQKSGVDICNEESDMLLLVNLFICQPLRFDIVITAAYRV